MGSDVQRYIDSVRDERRAMFLRLQKIIREQYPRAAVGIAYGVPTYGTKPGRVGLGYWKDGVSFYPYSGSALDDFRKKHPGIKTSKGSINFRTTDKVPLATLKRLIRTAMERRPAD
jgi:uncharacterized protein YdhG (YjbR/CyaY superfamily)